MSVPGSNLLNMALSIIAPQMFEYYQFVSRTPNAVGQDIATYAVPVTYYGSVQPVPRQLFEQYGLEFNRSYMTFFIRQEVFDVTRDVSGDQMFFNGKMYNCLYKTDWFAQDKWVSVLAVRIDV